MGTPGTYKELFIFLINQLTLLCMSLDSGKKTDSEVKVLTTVAPYSHDLTFILLITDNDWHEHFYKDNVSKNMHRMSCKL